MYIDNIIDLINRESIKYLYKKKIKNSPIILHNMANNDTIGL